MEQWFKIFLVCVLAFCVLVGAFCIVWPIAHPTEPVMTSPPNLDPEPAPEPEPDPEPEPEPAPEPEPEPQPVEPDPEPAEPRQPTAEERRAQALLRTMELDEKVWQLFVATPEQLTGVDTATIAGETTKKAIQEKPVGGIIYFAKNLVNREQAQALLETTQSFSKRKLLLMVDEEGGVVSRAGSNPDMGMTSFANMGDYGDAGDAGEVREAGKTIGSELLELGFNMDLAPVADVLTNPDNSSIGRRAFSSDPKVASEMVSAMVEGLIESGCIPTLKHFPGQGGADGDSHDGAVKTASTLDEMTACEFLPFQAGIEAGAPVVMVGHVSAPALDSSGTPASLSGEVITGVLRKRLGFDGVVITDALDMDAVTDRYSSAEAAVAAIEAGADLLLMPEDLDAAVEGVLDAVRKGTIDEERIDESVVRIIALKYTYKLDKR